MNARLLAVAVFITLASSTPAQEVSVKSASAQQVPLKSDALMSPSAASAWEVSPRLWITKEPSGLKPLHAGNFVVEGPLIQGFRPYPASTERSLAGKFMEWPVVRLFVPQRMPPPSGGGRYFAWGQSSQPWVAFASGGASATGFDTISSGPRNALISCNW